jgi:hypothetical protein
MQRSHEQCVDHLLELLKQERRAIGAFDMERLSQIAFEKDEYIQMLRDIVPATKDRLGELLREADANRALINSALDTIQEMLGVKNRAGTYDARARLRPQAGSVLGKEA